MALRTITALIIPNEETEDIMKIVKSLDDSGLLMEGVNQTLKNEGKEQRGEFLGMVVGTLSAALLGNVLVGKGTKACERSNMRAHT